MTGLPALEVRNVTKQYVKYEDTPMLVSRLLQLRNKTKRSKLLALRDIDFDVAHGEAIGIVGQNGSGKSTLLQVLAGTTSPTSGTVTVRGRVAPLISVGVGFHPELSGRENVYVNGLILGMTREEIDARFDEIVAFSEIGDFIDTPVKFYSSGMFVRLGFSVSAMASPDILLLDEVLAVGDLAFQLKCFDRITELREQGTTFVLVSHNLNAIRRLCDRLLVLHKGTLRQDGAVDSGLALYHELLGEQREIDGSRVDPDTPHAGAVLASIGDVRLVDEAGEAQRHLETGERVTAEAVVEFSYDVEKPQLAMQISNEAGILASSTLFNLSDTRAGTTVRVRIPFDNWLAGGSFSVRLTLAAAGRPRIAAPSTAFPFYVAGRPGVVGLADLGATLQETVTSTGPNAGSDR